MYKFISLYSKNLENFYYINSHNGLYGQSFIMSNQQKPPATTNSNSYFRSNSITCPVCEGMIVTTLPNRPKNDQGEPKHSSIPCSHCDKQITITRSLYSYTVKMEQSSSCFIATTVYGSAYHPQVVFLRYIRDNYLNQTRSGRVFIKVYYAFLGEMGSKIIRVFPSLRSPAKKLLDRLVIHLKVKLK